MSCSRTGAIDDVHRATAQATAEKYDEGKRIIESLATLKYELQHNRALVPIADDGGPDIAGYNEELRQLTSPTWFDVPWLYAECYMYRRVHSLFALTQHWKSYDVFAQQKLSSFRSSRPAVLELAARYHDLMGQLEAADRHVSAEANQAEQLLFTEMCEICLWGNATDLSLLTTLTYDDIQKLQGSEARKTSEKNVLVNDLPHAYQALKTSQRADPGGERRVDIVLDNAGFELFVDLILAGYLLAAKLATTIVLHPKSMPWFVSDVVPADFAALLSVLADPQTFYAASVEEQDTSTQAPALSAAEVEHLSFVFSHWSGFHEEGQLVIRPNQFWTHAGSYWRLPESAPRLHQDLQDSELVIFKGDLNYRKLTADAPWDPTEPFARAIGPLGLGSGIRTLALRTCKADVVVGLPPHRDEELRAMADGGGDSGARKWAWTGKWAVVQFCDGK
ncbi:MAG: hypothetical protein M1838_002973 [Thelocarpon superellum]|nr:MAG: hypothetical protein M1838_002973 [Thelocarpon superellum]